MEITEGLKIIDTGWVQKPKGFRVKYRKLVEGQLVTELSPPEGKAGLDSDVVAWRYAWKLYMATRSDADGIQDGELVNIHVVNDAAERVKCYATNDFDEFNPK
ncbi:MAG: hypothetical protein [Olavius algarvensis Delta 4 endosymbiont]|nr:MAG: hypothetical protein [Olavius algarvensis Delta 4 endosymbiont]